SNRSALVFPLLYPSIQAYPTACISGVSLWLDTMLGSAPYDNNSRTSSISAENAARANAVANVVRGVKFRADRRHVGMLFTKAFGSARLARSFCIRGIGSMVTIHGIPGLVSIFLRSTAQNSAVKPSASA